MAIKRFLFDKLALIDRVNTTSQGCEDKTLLEAAITPTVMLGIVLFILIFFVVRIWLLQDEAERREERDRRQFSDNPAFPFFDAEGRWVTNERRKHPDRRRTHTFIVSQNFHQPE